MQDCGLQMLPHPAIAADATHCCLSIRVRCDVDLMALRLGPARLVREVGGDGKEFARAAHPSNCFDVAERVALGMFQPQRPVDIVWLHPAYDARIDFDFGELDLDERS